LKYVADAIYRRVNALYEIELEPEVATWLEGLSDKHFGKVNDASGVLAELGPATSMPLARPLHDGVWELRLTLGVEMNNTLIWACWPGW
jgi:hypothetical protein